MCGEETIVILQQFAIEWFHKHGEMPK